VPTCGTSRRHRASSSSHNDSVVSDDETAMTRQVRPTAGAAARQPRRHAAAEVYPTTRRGRSAAPEISSQDEELDVKATAPTGGRVPSVRPD